MSETHITEGEYARLRGGMEPGRTYKNWVSACGKHLTPAEMVFDVMPTCEACYQLWARPFPTTPKPDEQVNSPAHYNAGKVEVIDMIESAVAPLGPRAFEAYCAGNVLKYVSRFSKKGGKTDLQKAAWYLSRLIDRQP